MDYKEIATAVKLCGSTPKADQCRKCPYWAEGNMSKCIPRMTADCSTAITDLLARAEAAEARAEKAERERDAAVDDISDVLARIDDVRERVGVDNPDADGELAELCAGYCLRAGKMCYKRGESCKCDNFKWRGQKEE